MLFFHVSGPVVLIPCQLIPVAAGRVGRRTAATTATATTTGSKQQTTEWNQQITHCSSNDHVHALLSLSTKNLKRLE